jgi:hypothetical protein
MVMLHPPDRPSTPRRSVHANAGAVRLGHDIRTGALRAVRGGQAGIILAIDLANHASHAFAPRPARPLLNVLARYKRGVAAPCQRTLDQAFALSNDVLAIQREFAARLFETLDSPDEDQLDSVNSPTGVVHRIGSRPRPPAEHLETRP